MKYFGIGLAIIIIIYLTLDTLRPYLARKKFYNRLLAHFTDYQIIDIRKENLNLPIDFVVKTNNQKYLIKLIDVPRHAEIIVNAKTTWELRYGAGDVPGKAHPIKKYLPKMQRFMNYQTNEDELKLVVFMPDVKKRVRYINESEMVFLDPTTDVYGVRVLNESEIVAFISNGSLK